MAASKYQLGPAPAALLAVLIAISTMVMGEVLSGQPRSLRLLASVAAAVVLSAIVFFVAKRIKKGA